MVFLIPNLVSEAWLWISLSMKAIKVPEQSGIVQIIFLTVVILQFYLIEHFPSHDISY